MRLGFITACLPDWDLDGLCAEAARQGYRALEVCTWPARGPRADAGPTHVDVEGFGAGDADATREVLERHGIEVVSLAYYDNNLHPDADARRAAHEHLHRCIDAAALLDVPTVGTFVGRDPTRTVAEDLRAAEELFGPLVDHAGERGVTLVIENCAMDVWHPDGYPGNLAYSPELWDWMFELGLQLNYDPSHLVWMGIDPVAVIEPYADRIALAQAKDVEVRHADRNRTGWPGPAVDPDADGWWEYRAPGNGVIDWAAVVGRLAGAGYDGVLSVELEDDEFAGDDAAVLEGLRRSAAALRPHLPRDQDVGGPPPGRSSV